MATYYLVAYVFFDHDGNRPTRGGLQRYVHNLVHMLEAGGHDCVILQKSHREWEHKYAERSRVVGIPSSHRWWGNIPFNIKAHRLIPEKAPVIYASMELAAPICRRNSLGIQHGIWWDGEYGFLKVKLTEIQIKYSAKRLKKMICVDTNFINWFRARFFDHSDADKMVYVPNFVDDAVFGNPPPVPQKPADRINILFPRRSEYRRGIFLMTDAAQKIMAKHDNVHFTYAVGDGYKTEELKEYFRKKGMDYEAGSISLINLPMEKMGEAYQNAHISVVPTICGEGTSLSCIEAMHYGNAVVATNVGGLANLVIDDYNGILINPNVAELAEALDQLIGDSELRSRLGKTAHEMTRRSFSLKAWENKVGEILDDLI